jgi:hypothetical protein
MKWFLLNLVPRPFRSHRPFRRWFWQPDQIVAIHVEAQQMYENLKPFID